MSTDYLLCVVVFVVAAAIEYGTRRAPRVAAEDTRVKSDTGADEVKLNLALVVAGARPAYLNYTGTLDVATVPPSLNVLRVQRSEGDAGPPVCLVYDSARVHADDIATIATHPWASVGAADAAMGRALGYMYPGYRPAARGHQVLVEWAAVTPDLRFRHLYGEVVPADFDARLLLEKYDRLNAAVPGIRVTLRRPRYRQ